MMFTFLILIGILVLILLYGVSIYNRLVKLNILVQEAWSGIDVQLKKRYDLIPNLIETVKGYASHEQDTFLQVTEARKSAQNADTIKDQEQAENNLNRALVNLFAVAEQYPELKANENFLSLQNELSKVEGDIEKARRYYNGTVRDYNILVDSFPSNLVANATGFDDQPFFELENTEQRETPKVEF